MWRQLFSPAFYILNDLNEPVRSNFFDWAEWVTRYRGRCRIGYDQVGTIIISTVFTGACSDASEPNVFETLVSAYGRRNIVQSYTTWDAAVVGHKEWCEAVVKRATAESN